jgi:type IV pilus assembly protein PilB
MMSERFFTREQVAELLGSTTEAVDEWMRRGWLEYRRVPGRELQIPRDGLVRFMKGQGMDIDDVLEEPDVIGPAEVEEPGRYIPVQTIRSHRPVESASPSGQPSLTDAAREILLAAETSVADAMIADDAPTGDPLEHLTSPSVEAEPEVGPEPEAEAEPEPEPAPIEEPQAVEEPGPEPEPGLEPLEPDESAVVTDEPDVGALAQALLEKAHSRGAQAMHLDPAGDGLTARFRVGGQLLSAAELAADLPDPAPRALIEALQARCTGETLTVEVDGRELLFRVVACPTVNGPKLVVQPLAADGGIGSLQLPVADQNLLAGLLDESYGLIVVAGMSGAETAAALQAMSAQLTGPRHSVVLIERDDRVHLQRVTRCRDDDAIDTYAAADTDVVVLDGVRSAATAECICRTARDLLVLAGLGARSAADAVDALLEQDVGAWTLAEGLLAVLLQRNARRLCDACKRLAEPDRGLLGALGLGGNELPDEVCEPGGCDRCGQTGFVGRMGLRAVVPLGGRPAHLIRREAPRDEILDAVRQIARAAVRRAGMVQVREGRIPVGELIRLLGN